MKTKQMISFISWNTTTFLHSVLDNMIKDGDIYFYIYIFHFKEEDELQDHHHVIIYPAKPLDYNNIKRDFTEPQLLGLPALGISATPDIVQKGCDLHFILYVLHEPRYIKIKCKKLKKYVYKPENLVSNDNNTLMYKVHEAYTTTEFIKDSIINDLINQGTTPSELIDNGYIPIKEACAYHHYIQMKKEG